MTEQELIAVCTETVEELRRSLYIPWDTGNMATHALKYEITDKTFHVYLDLSEAPYAPYTNEPWTAARWNGKKNPNEGWWQEWCSAFMDRLSAKLKGELKQ